MDINSTNTLVVNQLNKDLLLCGYSLQIDASSSDHLFIQILIEFLSHERQNNLEKLTHFFYRIDLAENQINNLHDMDVEELTYLVLNRLKKKVIFRSNFK